LRIAGETLNSDIISYIKEEFKILLGEKTAEDLKMLIGSVYPANEPMEATVRGRDLVTGLPREVVITDSDIREAITASVAAFVDAAKEVIETTPPEIISDIMHRGVVLVGGGSLVHGMQTLLENELKIPIHLEEDAMTAVVRGMGVILEDVTSYEDILIDNEDELPPTF
jgi:rod shape-determining protein MreB and related proteins